MKFPVKSNICIKMKIVKDAALSFKLMFGIWKSFVIIQLRKGYVNIVSFQMASVYAIIIE